MASLSTHFVPPSGSTTDFQRPATVPVSIPGLRRLLPACCKNWALYFFLTKLQLFHPFANLVNTFRFCRTMRRRVWAIFIRPTERSILDQLPMSPPQHPHFWPHSFSIWFYEKKKLLFHLKGCTTIRKIWHSRQTWHMNGIQSSYESANLLNHFLPIFLLTSHMPSMHCNMTTTKIL